jgi:hypothetical protein
VVKVKWHCLHSYLRASQSHHVINRRTGVVSNGKTTQCSYKIFEFGFEAKQGQEIFQTSKMFRPPVQPTPPHIQQVREVLSPAAKLPGHEVNHPPPSSAVVKNDWSYTSTPPIHLHGMHRDDFIFTINWLKIDTQKQDESLPVVVIRHSLWWHTEEPSSWHSQTIPPVEQTSGSASLWCYGT